MLALGIFNGRGGTTRRILIHMRAERSRSESNWNLLIFGDRVICLANGVCDEFLTPISAWSKTQGLLRLPCFVTQNSAKKCDVPVLVDVVTCE